MTLYNKANLSRQRGFSMLFALIPMISLYIILIIALVVVAQKKNSASGHAREHAGSFRFYTR